MLPKFRPHGYKFLKYEGNGKWKQEILKKHITKIKYTSAIFWEIRMSFSLKQEKAALKSAEHGKISMIYGSLDPSYKYIPFVSNCVTVQIVDGADHVFSRHADILKKQ